MVNPGPFLFCSFQKASNSRALARFFFRFTSFSILKHWSTSVLAWLQLPMNLAYGLSSWQATKRSTTSWHKGWGRFRRSGGTMISARAA
eukprot:CAMPEP_0184208328 /NCGR_PEP_ID=MMETSP0976-20121227/11551_1 /TAXON_ID=483370 /ORGANISM="non described non described, Strain CCMP2097" /LENGTH=88 /DNA_ID=CAMNT_0026512985 /DNA_START=200 /DNA_END=463 /DNA_ORIENTATION=+